MKKDYFRWSKICLFWNELLNCFHFQFFHHFKMSLLTNIPLLLSCYWSSCTVSLLLWNKKGGGRGHVDCGFVHPHAPLSHICVSFFSFVFVLHVQFCKAKSRCTLSQVVHQQHSVTVSYRSCLQYSPCLWLSSPPPPLFSLSSLLM